MGINLGDSFVLRTIQSRSGFIRARYFDSPPPRNSRLIEGSWGLPLINIPAIGLAHASLLPELQGFEGVLLGL